MNRKQDMKTTTKSEARYEDDDNESEVRHEDDDESEAIHESNNNESEAIYKVDDDNELRCFLSRTECCG